MTDLSSKSFKEKCNLHFSNMLNILGDKATITLKSDNSTFEINCLFENQYFLIEDTTGDTGISSAKPRLVCKEEDVLNVNIDDLVNIDDTNYKIVELQSEGNGTMNLILNKV